MHYLEHHIVDHCNLKCKGCTHFSPLADPWFEEVEDFKRDFGRLAEIMHVDVIRIMGGEPLLHPNVCEFLRITRELFPDSQIQLVTNGILMQLTEGLIETLNENKIIVCISDYGIFKDLKRQLVGVQYAVVDRKGLMYNACLNLNGDEFSDLSFGNCDLHVNHWNFFQNGRFYHCCIGANIKIFNKYFGKDLPVPEGISIYDHTEKEINDYLNTITPLCRFCDTIQRKNSYSKFEVSKKEIGEWTCQ